MLSSKFALRERLPSRDEVLPQDPEVKPKMTLSARERFRRKIHLQWTLLHPSLRSLLLFMGAIVLFIVLLDVWDALFYRYKGEHKFDPLANQFAVVINTYRRPRQLASAVHHYAQRCGKSHGVGHVYVIWAELDVEPPSPEEWRRSNTRSAASHSDRVVPISVVKVAKDSLNSRFLPLDGLQEKAVFMVDDDILVTCSSLLQGLKAWQSNPDSMTGYYPRLATTSFIYHSWPKVYLRQSMNMVLTKAAFLHSRFMEIYSFQQPAAIRDYVDKHHNCEDIAMSILVANVTRAEKSQPSMPIYVEGDVTDQGLFNGISTGSGHMIQRSVCVRDLIEIYKQNGWNNPLEQTFDLDTAAWIQHAPGLRWQHRPSNFFEWLALENFFK